MAIFIIVVILFVLIWLYFDDVRTDKIDSIKKQIGASDVIYAGEYVMGHPEINSAGTIYIAVTNNDLILYQGLKRQLATIPKNAVTQVSIEDRSSINKRVTATRVLTLGILALAVPKKKTIEEYFIIIEWVDSKGIEHQTTFKKEGMSSLTSANTTRNSLLKFINTGLQDRKTESGEAT